MAGMSVSTGLVSGIDYDTMISQLMQVEANPQTLLKKQLSETNADATAYRAVNTRFDALRTAAAALTEATAWNATKTTSSSPNVTATAGTTATAGASISFTVTRLAGTHSQISGGVWTSKTAPVASGTGTPPTWPITITNTATGKATVVEVAADATLTDAAAAINKAGAGVTASVVQLGKDSFRLQLAATGSGAAGVFTVAGAGGSAAGFQTTDQGQDAMLTLAAAGATSALTATSSTNTFADLLPGVTITATKVDPDTRVTVGVAADPSAVAAKVQSLIDSANGLLKAVSSYTDATSSSAVLKGDSTLRGLANQILGVVSSTLGGKSASVVGIQLTRTGELTFDKDVFTAKLADDPALVQKMFAEKTVSAGADGISGTTDDVTAAVGLAAKLEALAKGASDSTTGSLVLLAKSEDSLAKDLQARIDAWDNRLALRKASITRQFTAMETALSSMQNKGAWLSSQIASLPTWSQSK